MKRTPQVELSTVAYSAEHASRVGTKHTTPEVKFSEKPEDLHRARRHCSHRVAANHDHATLFS
jgi:hypothetical protein